MVLLLTTVLSTYYRIINVKETIQSFASHTDDQVLPLSYIHTIKVLLWTDSGSLRWRI